MADEQDENSSMTESDPGAPQSPPRRSRFARIFIGPKGIRPGWRLGLFVLFFGLIIAGTQFALLKIPAMAARHKAANRQVMTPTGQIIGESLGLFALFVSVWLMSLIEKRTLQDYYLPLRQAFGKRFWQGVPYGFAMLSLLMAMIGLFHGFSLGGMALSPAEAVHYGLLYAIGFIMVGLFEEFSFRGYMQSTLTEGIGFWPAAIVLSIVFGSAHLGNIGEAWFGALMAGSYGLLAAFALSRTGNIWFPIGLHAGWDWGETFFYSTPDSGFLAKGHLLNSSFHGATWITGGTVGPEGSAFVFLVLVLGALGIHLLFPAPRVRG